MAHIYRHTYMHAHAFTHVYSTTHTHISERGCPRAQPHAQAHAGARPSPLPAPRLDPPTVLLLVRILVFLGSEATVDEALARFEETGGTEAEEEALATLRFVYNLRLQYEQVDPGPRAPPGTPPRSRSRSPHRRAAARGPGRS